MSLRGTQMLVLVMPRMAVGKRLAQSLQKQRRMKMRRCAMEWMKVGMRAVKGGQVVLREMVLVHVTEMLGRFQD